MRTRNLITVVTVSLWALSGAYAGQAGFIYQGKEYIVFKDGQKVGKDFVEIFGTKDKRQPASFAENPKGWAATNFSFEDQDTGRGVVRCYTISSASLSCLLLPPLKAEKE